MTLHFKAVCLAALVSLAAVGGATAQPDVASGDIVVTGSRVEEMAQSYAGSIAVAPEAADQYARWNFRLCPSVAGVEASAAQTLIDHIARRAHQVGVEVERSGCQPNLVIIFAPDSDVLARQIVDQRRDLLGYYTEDDVVTAGRDALERFASTSRAVRWWHVSRRTTADGGQLGDSRSRTGAGNRAAVAAANGGSPMDSSVASGVASGRGFSGVEAVRSQGSRVRRDTRQDLSFALVIVDARRAGQASAAAMADYLAMATLVQLDPDADMSPFPSVLNLFSTEGATGQPTPTGMTDWDLAYLQGLYSAERAAATARQQEAAIARHMADQVRH
ncbi:MAG: hypothetical protein AB7O98_01135 [Hyphomonadaceae bacterium]